MSHDAFGNPTDPRDQPPAAHATSVGPPPGGEQPTNGRAITSLILGLAGIFIIPVLLSIPAIVFGNRAKREIAAGQGTGRGIATAGQVLGWIGTVLGVLFVVGLVVFGVFLADQISTAP